MRLYELINIYCKASNKLLYFFRNTNTPHKDIERNFSGYAGTWVKSEEEALYMQTLNPGGYLSKPKQDPHTKLWCWDPELGLSGFSFYDERTFNIAKLQIKKYITLNEIAVFSSSDYDLDAGADGEDAFRNANFLFYFDIDKSYDEFIKLL